MTKARRMRSAGRSTAGTFTRRGTYSTAASNRRERPSPRPSRCFVGVSATAASRRRRSLGSEAKSSSSTGYLRRRGRQHQQRSDRSRNAKPSANGTSKRRSLRSTGERRGAHATSRLLCHPSAAIRSLSLGRQVTDSPVRWPAAPFRAKRQPSRSRLGAPPLHGKRKPRQDS